MSFFIFLQSLKSDEEGESAKEPQNELFEAKGKAMASWLVLPFTSALKAPGAGLSNSEPAKYNFLEVCNVGGVPGGPLLEGGSSYEAVTLSSASSELRS